MSTASRAAPLVALAAVALIAALAAGCFVVRTTSVDPVSTSATIRDSVTVKSVVKAHLIDGSTIRYPNGVTVARRMVTGFGVRYDVKLEPRGQVSTISLDSILGMETYRTTVNGAQTFLVSTLATGGGIIAGVAIACAADPKCFGSCPTFYSDSAGEFVLEAEGFSYSIAPLFEARDVDRLRARPWPDGSVRLEVRNEAYETHYLNHLELLEARHRTDEFLAPDAEGRAVALSHLQRVTTATDRAGNDIRLALALADGKTTRTDAAVLARAHESDIEDTIDIALPVPRGADSAALVLRMRNSLLNTVLLYETVLGDHGARALNWMSHTVDKVGPALALGQWYGNTMGMRVLVMRGDSADEIAHLRDTGPVAWKDLAVMLPATRDSVIHVRLVFVADDWRIDRLAIGAARHVDMKRYSVAQVLGADEGPDTAARASLLAPDARYLETSAGQRFTAIWRPDAPKAGETRTFFLASQGYYIEWIRQGWLPAPRDTLPFKAGPKAIATAVSRWRKEQDSLEVKFARTRVPVR